eukprot:6198266-Pleurochrysis_carterae.AAC.3
MVLGEGCGGTNLAGLLLCQDGVEGHAAVHFSHAVPGAQRVAADVLFRFQKCMHGPVALTNEEMCGAHVHEFAFARQHRDAADETVRARQFVGARRLCCLLGKMCAGCQRHSLAQGTISSDSARCSHLHPEVKLRGGGGRVELAVIACTQIIIRAKKAGWFLSRARCRRRGRRIMS